MNSLERILTTMNHNEPDRVPIFGDIIDSPKIIAHYNGPSLIGAELSSFVKLGRIAFPIGWKRILGWFYKKLTPIRMNYLLKQYKFYESIGADLTYFPSNTPIYIKFLDKKTVITDWGSVMKLHTLPGGFETFYYEKGYWKCKEDYEAWRIPDVNDPKIGQTLRGYQKIREKLNEIVIFPTFGEMFDRIWMGFGMSVFSKLLYQEPKFIKKVFDTVGEFIYNRIKLFLELDPSTPIILFCDDLGEKLGPMISPRLLKKLVFPWHKKICDMAHKRGTKVILHSCGNIREIIPNFIESGFDALNPIQSTVPMDIFEIHEKFGDKITLVGNVPMPLLTNGTVEDVRKYTLKLLKIIAPGGGLIMAADHSIPPNTILDNFVKGMIETTKKHGIYPIKI